MAYTYDAQVAKQQADLNTANEGKTGYVPLKVDGFLGPKTQETIQKYGYNTQTGQPNTPSPLVTPTPASDLTPAANVPLATPTAQSMYTNYTTSLAGNVDAIKKNVDATYKQQLADIAAKKKTLESTQTVDLEKMDPTQRSTYEQEQRIKQNELNASETASKTIEADFVKRRALTDELSSLLTQGNALIEEQKAMPVGQSVINKKLNSTMTDISARTGVIQAVFSALDGNISQAYNMINQAKDTVSAEWTDNLNYYNTLLKLHNDGILSLDKEEKTIADKQVKDIETNLANATKTADYIKTLMVDPASAQFIADSGVKLTDSVEQINQKLAVQSKVQEIKEAQNTMAEKGYVYVPFPQDKTGLMTISAGGKTMYFKENPTKTAGTTATKADKANDIASAVMDFQNQINTKGWAGANPAAYEYYRTQLANMYGASAALELDKAMEDKGITVDYTNK